jgi:hypothetical protein
LGLEEGLALPFLFNRGTEASKESSREVIRESIEFAREMATCAAHSVSLVMHLSEDGVSRNRGDPSAVTLANRICRSGGEQSDVLCKQSGDARDSVDHGELRGLQGVFFLGGGEGLWQLWRKKEFR